MMPEKVLQLETELETVLEKVKTDVLALREENAALRIKNLEIVTFAENERKWKEEASALILLQRATLQEFQKKYRRALLYADDLQKRLKTI